MRDVAPLLAMLGMTVGICWVIWVIASYYRRREWLRLTAETQNRLLDRIGTTAEFSEFLESEGGRRLLDSMSAEQPESSARRRVLGAVQAGTVLSFLGVGLLLIGSAVPYDDGAFSILGGVALSTGLGFLASAAVSSRLMRAWEN